MTIENSAGPGEAVGQALALYADGDRILLASRIPEITRYVPSGGFTGSEDAAYLMSRVQAHGGKAAYMCIGCDIAAPHHNARFDIDENALMTGLKLYVSVLWELLGQKQ